MDNRTRGFERVSRMEEDGEFIALPKRATVDSAGYDLCSAEFKVLKPGCEHIFKTGIKAYMQIDEYLAVHIRSSKAIKEDLRLINQTGIVDADYYNNPDNEGEILIAIKNVGFTSVAIMSGERIAQGIFTKFLKADNDEFCGIRRGGVGSTDETASM